MKWAKTRHFADLERRREPAGYISIPVKVKKAISDYENKKITILDLNELWEKEKDAARDSVSALDLDPDRFIPEIIVSDKGQGNPTTWNKRFGNARKKEEWL